MADNIGMFDLSASLMVSATSSLDASGSLDNRRGGTRRLYNKFLLGEALRTTVGQPPALDTNLTAEPPSWTQHAAGLNHSFVMQPLSAAFHEKQVLNAYLSGTPGLESSPVPASGSSYYSKQGRFRRYIFAVTASAGLSDTFAAPTSSWASDFGSGRPTFVAASGSFICHGRDNPASVKIPVSIHGKLVNLRVWIEFVTDMRITDYGGFPRGIGATTVVLRCPNNNIGQGLPILNDPQLVSQVTSIADSYIFKNSYILWMGDAVNFFSSLLEPGYDDWNTELPNNRAPYWNYDIDMRTVFDDGAETPNPINALSMYQAGLDGNATGLYGHLSGASPNARYLSAYGPLNSITSSAYGHWIPWFADYRIKGGRLEKSGSYANWKTLVSGSPPSGWLTGPGGTNTVSEWPTTGSNVGVTSIKPFYPIMDDIDVVFPLGNTVEPILKQKFKNKYRRKGLRGVEVNGTWEILFCSQGTSAGLIVSSVTGTEGTGIWFRQARLEMLIEENAPSSFGSRRDMLFAKPGNVNRQAPVSIQSGSFGKELVIVPSGETYGRSIGIIESTGSVEDFAVFTRLTGALANYLTGSQHADARFKFLHNEFGTPQIPLFSGSVSGQSSQLISSSGSNESREFIDRLFGRRTLVSQQRDARVDSSRFYAQTSAQKAEGLKLEVLAASGST